MSKITPYEIELNGNPFWVVDNLSTRDEYLTECVDMNPADLGVIALGLFRRSSYVDYAAIGVIDDVEHTTVWTRAYEAYEWIDWMAGVVYRQPERAKQLHSTERSLGRFLLVHGWAPDIVVESQPSPDEIDGFIQHVVGKDEVSGQLVFPED